MNIAFIGLGRMGWHIAAHLKRAGHSLSVYDASSNLPSDWVKAFGGRAGLCVADTVTGAECVMTSLPADAALQSVWDLAQSTLASGAIWVDHSTTSAEIAKRLAKTAKEQGRHFIDAPVSGGTVGAEKGTFAIMAGADESAWSVVEPLMKAYAQRASLIGPPGAGQLTKMSNQICVAGIGQALAEGLAFAEHHGLDSRKVLDVMLKGSSTSWMMENRAQTMIDGKFDFGFSTTLMRKDLGLVMEEAHRADVSLPVTALVAQLLSDVSAMGLANADWCSLMQRQRRVQSGE